MGGAEAPVSPPPQLIAGPSSGLSPGLQALLQTVSGCDPDTKRKTIKEYLQAEREAADRRAEKEAEREERRAEREERRAEREAAEQERERRAEREAAEREREAEREEREAARAHELEMAKLQLQSPAAQPAEPRRARSPPREKFPVMDDQTDLDIFLRAFECTCRQYQLPETQWAEHFTPGLKGKALDVFSNLPREYDGNYRKIKEALIRRFNLTPEGYRKKFRGMQKGPTDSFSDVLCRLRTTFREWIKGPASESQGALEDLMIQDQLLHICPPEIRCYIREKEPKTAEQAAELADRYEDNRPPPSCQPQLVNNERAKPKPPSPFSPPTNRRPPDTAPSSPRQKPRNSDPRSCFLCQEVGHVSYACPTRSRLDPLVQPYVPPPSVSWASAQPRRFPAHCQPVTVGNSLTTGLRDTGAEVTLVRPELVTPENILSGKMLTVTVVGGRRLTMAGARVYLDWGTGRGMREVGVTADIPVGVLLGNDLGPMESRYRPAPWPSEEGATSGAGGPGRGEEAGVMMKRHEVSPDGEVGKATDSLSPGSSGAEIKCDDTAEEVYVNVVQLCVNVNNDNVGEMWSKVEGRNHVAEAGVTKATVTGNTGATKGSGGCDPHQVKGGRHEADAAPQQSLGGKVGPGPDPGRLHARGGAFHSPAGPGQSTSAPPGGWPAVTPGGRGWTWHGTGWGRGSPGGLAAGPGPTGAPCGGAFGPLPWGHQSQTVPAVLMLWQLTRQGSSSVAPS